MSCFENHAACEGHWGEMKIFTIGNYTTSASRRGTRQRNYGIVSSAPHISRPSVNSFSGATRSKQRRLPSQPYTVLASVLLQLFVGVQFDHGGLGTKNGIVVGATSESADQIFSRFFERMERDALEMAREVERLYVETEICNSAELDACSRANYDHCSSRYPPETAACTSDPGLRDPICGPPGSNCSVLYDFSATTVRLPLALQKGPRFNPTDPAVIESLCFSRHLDPWLANKYVTDTPSWQAEFGMQPRSYYFGSVTGSFRIFPGRRHATCGSYDPRVRPWYVAASSGPKNVILILDTSGSMTGQRLSMLQQAAKKVVSMLAVGDRVGIVTFNSEATRVFADGNGQSLYTTSAKNKDLLSAQIDTLSASGATNFAAGFTGAFDLLDRSIDNGSNVACTTALLFFTDGTMTLPRTALESDVISMIQSRTSQSSAKLGGNLPILLFTYSISDDPQNFGPDRFPSRLACSVPTGVWSKIESEDKIVSSLSSYTSLVALGLGNAANFNFVAWVEPYKFASNNVVGTTVSVPVYDRRSEPNLFIGVIGVDIALDSLQASVDALSMASTPSTGGGNVGADAITRVVAKSTAVCPLLNLTTCTLESFRLNTVGQQKALCTNQCSNGTEVELKLHTCKDKNSTITYPTDFWINTQDANISYAASVCCIVGEHMPSSECPAAPTSAALLSRGIRPFVTVLFGSVIFFSWAVLSTLL